MATSPKKKRYILLKLEDIKQDDAPLIAELKDVRIFAAVFTKETKAKDADALSLIKPAYFLADSDKDKAFNMLTTEYGIKSKDIIVPESTDEKGIRTARVILMESLYDKALGGKASKDDIRILDKYLASGFKGDFEADENGMFPQTLKRGVLSEAMSLS